MSYQEHFFDNRELLVQTLTSTILEKLHPSNKLFVSGGSTPKALFQSLSKPPFDWSSIEINLVDERWVPPDHGDSNAKLVSDHLKTNAVFQPLYLGVSPEDDCAKTLVRLANYKDFGIVILGMGTDGHTASLFPGLDATRAALLDEAPLLTVTNPINAPHSRIGLTLTGIRKAKHLILHIEGQEKRQIYENAKADDLPISHVLHDAQIQTHVYWAP
jgi:6-phosphogluconolactonase